MSHIRFSRFVILAALAVAMLVPVTAAARIIVGVGPIFPWGYGYGYYGPYGYPYGGGYWGPYAYGPPYGYGYGYGPYGYGNPLGEVQIKSPVSKAQIYINGSLAGQAHDLKKIYLKPGTYNVEQRIGNDVQKQRIYVLAHRTLKIEFGKPGTPSPQPPPPPPDAEATQPQSPPPPPAPLEEQPQK